MNDYTRHAFDEIFAEDGLLVMAKGLGLAAGVFSKLLLYYSQQHKYLGRKNIFCLNCYGIEEPLKARLLSFSSISSELPQIINNEVNSQERIEKYAEGGCFIITSRILIVDLLENRITPSNICGIFVYNAHQLNEMSIEAFIIRVYREKNRIGFLKAFSDEAESFLHGYGKVERLLKILYVKKLYLYPRFRKEVIQSFERYQPEVIELAADITPAMKIIQNAILVAMNTCIQELKKSNPHLETSQMTLENGLFQAFDYSIKSQLEPEWHRVSVRSKQLITDLTSLRKLLDYLIRYDAISFHYYLLRLQAQSSQSSLWLMSDAADQIFRKAKERVYKVIQHSSNNINYNPKQRGTSNVNKVDKQSDIYLKEVTDKLNFKEGILQPALESPPKWKLLTDIMNEIKQDYYSKLALNKTSTHNNNSTSSSYTPLYDEQQQQQQRVLLLTQDEKSLNQLKHVLECSSIHAIIDQRYRWFISQQATHIRNQCFKNSSNIHENHKTNKSTYSNKEVNINIKNVQFDNRVVSMNRSDDITNKRNRDTYEEDSNILLHNKINNHPRANNKLSVCDNITDSFSIKQYLNLPTEKSFDNLDLESKLILIHEQYLKLKPVESSSRLLYNNMHFEDADNVIEIDSNELFDQNNNIYTLQLYDDEPTTTIETNNNNNNNNTNNMKSKGKKKKRISLEQSSIDMNSSQISQQSDDVTNNHNYHASVVDDDLHMILMTIYEAKKNLTLLEDLQPAYIILYDPDITMIRTIEAYQALISNKVKVYFMVYEGSAEEHRYVSSLAKEKKAFEYLIATKQHLVVSLPDHPSDIILSEEPNLSMSINMDTRTLYPKVTAVNRKIVVDVREFRSMLPSMLHFAKFEIIPRTLEVADYVLSPEICIERKGIEDLFSSFISGRLYNQVEAMNKYYKYPCLLIEFHPDKPFTLLAANEIPSDIQQYAISSKLVLLTMAFPNLRILWSRSPAATVDIFRSLVINHEEVDVEKALSVGSLSSHTSTTNTTTNNTNNNNINNNTNNNNSTTNNTNSTTNNFTSTSVNITNTDNVNNNTTTTTTTTDATTIISSPVNALVIGKTHNEIDRDDFSHVIQEILLALPGITIHNYREIQNKVNSLAELCTLSEEDLINILGPTNGKKLFSFINQYY